LGKRKDDKKQGQVDREEMFENGRMTNFMERAPTITPTEEYTQEIGKMTSVMARAHTSMPTEMSIVLWRMERRQTRVVRPIIAAHTIPLNC
jgi:hypothetical protein